METFIVTIILSCVAFLILVAAVQMACYLK